ncbi:DUF5074 domain-containing protein [uncultured Alistipes sp.]|jgi:hypothetical protein|uniref:DUF5074 domain-containing protein n=1 Tax=uncultured Alistipes sp. TaxID=538949 RepID=UPI0025FD1C4B|nr:DUF5074 domain-containing protein [uncultured Alistipes sp.]
MKRFLPLFCGLLLAGCSSGIEEYTGAIATGSRTTLIGTSGATTRTQFVPADGADIHFRWSPGDYIWAGGIKSTETSDAGTTAEFGFTTLPDAPYPVYYNLTGEGANAVIPENQKQTAAYELSLGGNGDFGYATVEAEGRFTLGHATSFIWFNPWSTDVTEKLISVTLTATDGTLLAGTATFTGQTLDNFAGGNSVTLSFDTDGVALPAASDDSRVFAAAVIFPADCSAAEVYVTYRFADGSIYAETKPGKAFTASKVHRLTTEITKRNGGTLRVETGTAGKAATEPLCMKYGEKLEYPLTAEGWISEVKTVSAPAGWNVDLGIERRKLTIAPPAEYTTGMELENTAAFEADGATVYEQPIYVLDFTHPEGSFVLMEGNMTSENGTLLYFDQHMRYHQHFYEDANQSEIGNVVQDMYMANDRVYLITQNGAKGYEGSAYGGDGRFVICDAHTMKRLVKKNFPFYDAYGHSSSECWPQHIVVVSPTKAYIQYSIPMETYSGIRVVNLTNNTISQTDIEGSYGLFTKTGATKARMVVSRGKVYAGRGNSVIVIDPQTDAVIATHTYENRQVKDLAKAADGNIYAVFTGEFDGNSGMTGSAAFTTPAKVVIIGPDGAVTGELDLPEIIKLRTGTASPTIQMCASFTQPYLYFIGTEAFSETKAMRYNYQTGRVNWDYITPELDTDRSGGDIIYGYMGVHPTTEQLWVGKSTYTQSAIHVYDVSLNTAQEVDSFYQKKASPAGVDFAYRFSEEWINK